jgi:hypothetical protein
VGTGRAIQVLEIELIINLHTALLLMALICFLLSAVGVATRINLLALGLAAWVLTFLLA